MNKIKIIWTIGGCVSATAIATPLIVLGVKYPKTETQKTQIDLTEINFDNIKKDKNKVTEALTALNEEQITSFVLDDHEYTNASSEDAIKALSNWLYKIYPTLNEENYAGIETGWLEFEQKSPNIPSFGEHFQLGLPSLPEHLHFEYSVDTIYMSENPNGVKSKYWATDLNYFKAPKILDKDIVLNIKIVPDYGYATSNDTIYEIIYKQQELVLNTVKTALDKIIQADLNIIDDSESGEITSQTLLDLVENTPALTGTVLSIDSSSTGKNGSIKNDDTIILKAVAMGTHKFPSGGDQEVLSKSLTISGLHPKRTELDFNNVGWALSNLNETDLNIQNKINKKISLNKKDIFIINL